MILFIIISIIIIILGVLLSIAFFTLFERKILGLTQSRMGPNKVLFLGILQPLLDGVKLLIKEFLFPHFTSVWGFFVAPALFFILMAFLWVRTRFIYFMSSQNLLIFLFLRILGGSIYTSLLTGVNSFSKFALIGGTRSAAQAIRYEICLAFFIFSFIIFWKSLNFRFGGFRFLPLSLFWFILILSETNRAPFDFAEGERELIRGFNVEFRRIGFVFLFLGEYGIIIFLRFFRALIFNGSILLWTVLMRFLVVLIRRTLPRFRYDYLMGVYWYFFLPISIFIFSIHFILN